MSLPAYHSKGPKIERDPRAGQRVSVPASATSPEQLKADYARMRALVANRLIVFFPHTAKSEVAERYFAPSQQYLVEEAGQNGELELQIAGGWVDKAAARAILQRKERKDGLREKQIDLILNHEADRPANERRADLGHVGAAHLLGEIGVEQPA